MTTFKKSISILLALLVIVGVISVMPFTASANTSGDYKYIVLDNDTVQISKYTGSATELVIPVEIDGKIVTSIGDDAFYACENLTSITIPESVTSIGNNAFYECSSLTSVNISDIAAWFNICFQSSSANPLTCANNLYLNENLVTDLIIPDSVTSIGEYAFFGCSLTSVTIPDSVTSIGEYAFYDCTSLTSVTIPDSVTSIGEYAFNNTGYFIDKNNWEDNVLYIGKHLIKAKESLSGEYSIKPGTLTLASEAFEFCHSLTSITIPNSVLSIEDDAFFDVYKLKSVKISDIAAWCNIKFGYRSNPLAYARNFYLDETLVTDLVIPNGVTSIGDNAFDSYKSLTSVIIPDSVTSIGEYAFNSCEILESITIPDSVTSVGVGAFSECSSLTSVKISDIATWCNINFQSSRANPLTFANNLYLNENLVTDLVIPDSVTSIGEYAFYACTSLTSITIPDSVTSIGKYAFFDCSLKSVTIADSVTSIGDYALGFIYGSFFNKKIESFTIYGYEGSAAENYAGFYGFEFIKLADKPTQSVTTEPFTVAPTKPTTTEPVTDKPTEPVVTEPITPVDEPTQPNTDKPSATVKKANPIKVSVKAKTVKLKKLKKKAQTVKAITIKGTQGKVSCKVTKAAKIKKFLKINSKGVITFKKWKKAKKGTYKITVQIKAAGNTNYKAKTITKTVKVKIK